MILNSQRRVAVPVRLLKDFAIRASRALHLPMNSFTVCFVTDAQIARWNRAYRGKPGPTDVLSFPAVTREMKPGRRRVTRGRAKRGFQANGPSSYLGDIAIAPAFARRNARRWGRSFNDEIRILVLHGILHLMGYDHETDEGQMDRRERRLRRTFGLA